MTMAMDKPVYDYTEYQYAMIAYNKACTMFASLYELYGKEKFDACLKKYVADNRLGIGGKEAFIAAAQSKLGDVRGLLEGWIGEGTVATTFAEE